MDHTTKFRVVFTEGYVANRDCVVISARPEDPPEDEEYSRVFVFRGGQWGHFDLEATVRGVYCQTTPAGEAYALDRDGILHIVKFGQVPDKYRIEEIPGAGYEDGGAGFLLALRKIGSSLYACGMSGQIYKRTQKGWVRFDDGVRDLSTPPSNSAWLNAIDGSSEQSIYAVGKRARIWHYDGKSWTMDHLPMAGIFKAVRCVSPDENWVCGDGGAVYRGRRGKWDDFTVRPLRDSFTGVEAFKGKVYFAGDTGLYQFDGTKVVPLDTGLNPPPDGGRLHANAGVLWSFGPSTLAMFDGKTWSVVPHPDNP